MLYYAIKSSALTNLSFSSFSNDFPPDTSYILSSLRRDYSHFSYPGAAVRILVVSALRHCHPPSLPAGVPGGSPHLCQDHLYHLPGGHVCPAHHLCQLLCCSTSRCLPAELCQPRQRDRPRVSNYSELYWLQVGDAAWELTG